MEITYVETMFACQYINGWKEGESKMGEIPSKS